MTSPFDNLKPGYAADAFLSEQIGLSPADTESDYTGPPLLNYSTNYQHALEFMARVSPQLRPVSVYSWQGWAVVIVEGGVDGSGRVGKQAALADLLDKVRQ